MLLWTVVHHAQILAGDEVMPDTLLAWKVLQRADIHKAILAWAAQSQFLVVDDAAEEEGHHAKMKGEDKTHLDGDMDKDDNGIEMVPQEANEMGLQDLGSYAMAMSFQRNNGY